MDGGNAARKQTVGWTVFGAGLFIYVLGLSYLTNPANRYPDWLGHLIVITAIAGLLGFIQGLTGKGRLEFYRHQRSYPDWKQTLLNIFLLIFVGFLAINVVVLFARHHRVAD